MLRKCRTASRQVNVRLVLMQVYNVCCSSYHPDLVGVRDVGRIGPLRRLHPVAHVGRLFPVLPQELSRLRHLITDSLQGNTQVIWTRHVTKIVVFYSISFVSNTEPARNLRRFVQSPHFRVELNLIKNEDWLMCAIIFIQQYLRYL